MKEKLVLTLKTGVGIYSRTIFTLSMIAGLFFAFIYSIKSGHIPSSIILGIISIPCLALYMYKLFSLITYTLKIEVYEDKFIFKEKDRSKTFHTLNEVKEVQDISAFWQILDLFSPSSIDWLTGITTSEVRGRSKQGKSVMYIPSQPIHPKKLRQKLKQYLNEKS